MPSAPTKSGTQKLSEVARHLVVPDDIVSTGWPRVQKKCLDLGVRFDEWQEGLGRAILGKRADGKYASTVGGVVLSIPRQVGKTFTVGAILFALCILFPGLTVIWTAHRLKTAGETFRSMQGFAKRLKVAPYIENTYTGSGDEEVRFRNGSRILFGARERGFGRGFSEVDIIVFDEAQILTDKALDDMVPAANQSKHEHGALLFFMGTPPKPGDPGEAFTGKRTKALAGASAGMVYVEFSADAGAQPDDRKQWRKANPSYPQRTPLESMLRMRENLGSDESFLREALGIWDDLSGAAAFGVGNWAACAVGSHPARARVGGMAIALSYDQSFATISAGARFGDVVHVQPVEYGAGTRWVVEKAAQLQAVHGVEFAVDEKGPAAVLIPDLEAAGVNLRVLETRDVLDACAWIHTAVTETKRLAHGAFPELDRSVAGAVKRPVGDRWAWGRKTSTADLSPLESVTFAGWLADQRPDTAIPASSPEVTSTGGDDGYDTHPIASAGF